MFGHNETNIAVLHANLFTGNVSLQAQIEHLGVGRCPVREAAHCYISS